MNIQQFKKLEMFENFSKNLKQSAKSLQASTHTVQ